MIDEEKIRRAFKITRYELNKPREENEEIRKKLDDLEKRVTNLVKIGKN